MNLPTIHDHLIPSSLVRKIREEDRSRYMVRLIFWMFCGLVPSLVGIRWVINQLYKLKYLQAYQYLRDYDIILMFILFVICFSFVVMIAFRRDF